MKFPVLDENKYYRYFSCVMFLSVLNFKIFFIRQFGDLDLLKTTKNVTNLQKNYHTN